MVRQFIVRDLEMFKGGGGYEVRIGFMCMEFEHRSAIVRTFNVTRGTVECYFEIRFLAVCLISLTFLLI